MADSKKEDGFGGCVGLLLTILTITFWTFTALVVATEWCEQKEYVRKSLERIEAAVVKEAAK